MNDKQKLITEDMLVSSGFEYLERESEAMKVLYSTSDMDSNYKYFSFWTSDKHPLKLDIDNGYTNRGTKWHLHIDNEVCNTIGSADIDTVWEFNTLMEIFKSDFRL